MPHTRTAAQVVALGDAYGGRLFWYEILRTDSYNDSIRKALLYLGCLGMAGPELAIRQKLFHQCSRVRSAACRAVGLLRDAPSAEILSDLESDFSARVRCEARRALRALGVEANGREKVSTDEEPGDKNRPLILISDDDPTVQDRLAGLLSPHGFRLAYACSLEETMAMATRLEPKVVITDNQKGRDNQSGLRMTRMFAQDDYYDDMGLVMISVDPIAGPFLWEGGDRFYWKPMFSAEEMVNSLTDLTA